MLACTHLRSRICTMFDGECGIHFWELDGYDVEGMDGKVRGDTAKRVVLRRKEGSEGGYKGSV